MTMTTLTKFLGLLEMPKQGQHIIRYLESRKLANGEIAFYYNPPADARSALIAERCALGKDYEKAVTQASRYNFAIDEWRKEKKQIHTVNQNSVRRIFQDYLNSRKFTHDLAVSTQKSYRAYINELLEFELEKKRKFGDLPFKKIKPGHVDVLYEKLRVGKNGQDRLTHANAIMRVARLVFNIASRKYDFTNPFSNPKMKTTRARRVVWTDEQIALACKTAIEHGRKSLAIAIMLGIETGQRVGDTRSLKWDCYKDGIFTFEQSKTGAQMNIPASDVLISLLEDMEIEPGREIVIHEETDKPYDKWLISKTFLRVKKWADLPKELQLRDLRRTAITQLGDAGATEDEILSISGHADRSILDVYSQRSKAKAQAAIRKRNEFRKAGRSQ